MEYGKKFDLAKFFGIVGLINHCVRMSHVEHVTDQIQNNFNINLI